MNTRFIYMLLYDIPNQAKSKEFRLFRKEIKKLGAIMLQESVYIFYLSSKEAVLVLKNKLSIIAPPESHIRGIRLTQQQFEEIDILCGYLDVGEKLLKKDFFIIEV